jgi:hypothetical protein
VEGAPDVEERGDVAGSGADAEATGAADASGADADDGRSSDEGGGEDSGDRAAPPHATTSAEMLARTKEICRASVFIWLRVPV